MHMQELLLAPDEKCEIIVLYDSTYCRNKYSLCEEKAITVTYKEHPQTVRAPIRFHILS